MTKITTKTFKQHVAEQFVESISEPANNIYYVAASKHTPYSTGDDSVPDPVETIEDVQVKSYEEMVFGKKIQSTDINLVVPKYIWTSNTVYDIYDDKDQDLFTKQFYVAVDAGSFYYVYKVLDNAKGAPSTVQPSNTVESACNFITTGDGYKWKLMYKMAEATFEKFTTTSFMPVVTSANVAGNTVSGAIDHVKVEDAGFNYLSTLTGQFTVDDLRDAIPSGGNTTSYRLSTSASSNSSFYNGCAIYITGGTGAGQIRKINSYTAGTRVAVVNTAFTTAPSTDSTYLITPGVTFTGDGSGAAAYAVVSSNSTVNNFIDKVVMINRGENYTYASALVVGNTGGVSVNTSVVPVIPPVGGHGTNAAHELGCDSACISITFNNNESGYIPTENDYRKIMIVKDPLFNNVILTLGSQIGSFDPNETVYQVAYSTLIGTVASNTTSAVVTGSGTDFVNALNVGDYVVLIDAISQQQSISTVASITNSSVISIASNNTFAASYSTISKATVIGTGYVSSESTPYLYLSNTTPKFSIGRNIIGGSSGAWANVTAINIGEKSFGSWQTFDNRTRISYTANTGAFSNDATVYQTSTSLSNAFFHSANSTFVFLTSEKGPINADPATALQSANGAGSYTLGSTRYEPDLVKGAGEVVYIENKEPITRSNSQSEAIRVVLQF